MQTIVQRGTVDSGKCITSMEPAPPLCGGVDLPRRGSKDVPVLPSAVQQQDDSVVEMRISATTHEGAQKWDNPHRPQRGVQLRTLTPVTATGTGGAALPKGRSTNIGRTLPSPFEAHMARSAATRQPLSLPRSRPTVAANHRHTAGVTGPHAGPSAADERPLCSMKSKPRLQHGGSSMRSSTEPHAAATAVSTARGVNVPRFDCKSHAQLSRAVHVNNVSRLAVPPSTATTPRLRLTKPTKQTAVSRSTSQTAASEFNSGGSRRGAQATGRSTPQQDVSGGRSPRRDVSGGGSPRRDVSGGRSPRRDVSGGRSPRRDVSGGRSIGHSGVVSPQPGVLLHGGSEQPSSSRKASSNSIRAGVAGAGASGKGQPRAATAKSVETIIAPQALSSPLVMPPAMPGELQLRDRSRSQAPPSEFTTPFVSFEADPEASFSVLAPCPVPATSPVLPDLETTLSDRSLPSFSTTHRSPRGNTPRSPTGTVDCSEESSHRALAPCSEAEDAQETGELSNGLFGLVAAFTERMVPNGPDPLSDSYPDPAFSTPLSSEMPLTVDGSQFIRIPSDEEAGALVPEAGDRRGLSLSSHPSLRSHIGMWCGRSDSPAMATLAMDVQPMRDAGRQPASRSASLRSLLPFNAPGMCHLGASNSNTSPWSSTSWNHVYSQTLQRNNYCQYCGHSVLGGNYCRNCGLFLRGSIPGTSTSALDSARHSVSSNRLAPASQWSRQT